MELTPELKQEIDSWSHYTLLQKIRFCPIGDPMFQGETGSYIMSKYAEKRNENLEQAVKDSKTLGW